MKKVALIFLVLLVVAGLVRTVYVRGVLTQGDNVVISIRDQSITVDSNLSHQKLLNSFGKDYVKRTSIPLAEGSYQQGSIVFPDTPNELEVIWSQEKGQLQRPKKIIIDEDSSDWRINDNLRIGMTLDELEIVNGRSFTFAGFGWDYGGRSISWEDGNISEEIKVGLTITDNQDLEGIMGDDVQLTSGDSKVDQLDLKVTEILILPSYRTKQ